MILLIIHCIGYNVNIFIHKLIKAPIFLSVIVNLNIWFFFTITFFSRLLIPMFINIDYFARLLQFNPIKHSG